MKIRNTPFIHFRYSIDFYPPAPSDVVAYRQNCPSFRGDPVVSHYACAFKYPHHMAAYAEELPDFWYKYPRNDQMRRHRP